MDPFEQADVFTPSRTIQQEDEEQAAPSAHLNLEPPVIVWRRGVASQIPLDCQLLVIATCKTSCAVLRSFSGLEAIGTVLLPGVSLSGNTVGTSLTDQTCTMYRLGSGVVLLCCQYDVAPERAVAWTRHVMKQFSAQQTVVVGSLPAEELRTAGDPTQETLLFRLHTEAARQLQQQQQQQQQPASQPPLLPTGNVITGVVAAVMSHCQARKLAATALVVVQSRAGGLTWGVSPLLAALSGFTASLQADGGSDSSISLLRSALSSQDTASHAVRDLAAASPRDVTVYA